MIKRVSLAALALACGVPALVVTAVGPAAASVPAATPSYHCRAVTLSAAGQWIGNGNCEAANGAPATGPIEGTFTIASHLLPNLAITCTPPAGSSVSGNAALPGQVVGYQCRW